MRLCFIANPDILLRRWLRRFVERGYEIHLLADHSIEGWQLPGVILHDLTRQVNVRKVRYLAWAFAVRRLVRLIQPDILHAHQVTSAGWLGAAAGWHPLIVTAWGSDLLVAPRRSRMQRLLARWVLSRADYITCVSSGLAQQARLLGADPGRLEVVPFGVDTEVFRPAQPDSAFRARLGLGEGPVVLSLRAIRPVYNPLDVARAIPRVLEQVPTAQFVIRTYSYDPVLLEQFCAIVGEGGASHAVHYVGDLPDDETIADLYRLADVAVSVPYSDGTPPSVLEAMACGAVPVLSDIPSLHEWVVHEREGLFVPVGDVAAIAAAVVRLLNNHEERRRMQTAGIAMVRQRADSSGWMRYEEIYQRLIAQAKP